MGNRSKARRPLATMGSPTMRRPGARPEAPNPNPAEFDLDRRIMEINRTVEELDRALGKLHAKSEEVEAQLLKAMGAREYLQAMKGELSGERTSHGRPPVSAPPQKTGTAPQRPETPETDEDSSEPENEAHGADEDATGDNDDGAS